MKSKSQYYKEKEREDKKRKEDEEKKIENDLREQEKDYKISVFPEWPQYSIANLN